MVFDPSEPDIDEESFEKEDWSHSVHGNKQEKIPPNAPSPQGFGFKIRAYADSDHVGHAVMRRSRSGYLVYLIIVL